jgi:transcriptional regulator with XRE-family HTH domain
VHIGQTLREARERRGLSLDDAERATKIRARQLEALEAERFDRLPSGAYTRSFLREYADFLGLDGVRLVEEYKAQFPTTDPALEFQPLPAMRPLVSRGSKTAAVVLACAGLLGLLAWRLDSGSGGSATPIRPLAQPQTSPEAETPPHLVRARHRAPTVSHLTLVAARGDCWLSVRAGDRAGAVLWEGMLYQGQSRRFSQRSVWIRMGAPWNLDVRLNGKQVRTLPTVTANLLVTGAGAKLAT